MARHALDLDLPVPTALHDPRQTRGVVAVAFVYLHRQRRRGVTSLDADHRQAKGTQLVPKPGRGRTGLKANALRASRLCVDKRGNGGWFRDHPGYIHTAKMEETCRRDYGYIRTGLAALEKLHPIGRVGESEEIAAGVLYLASDESKFVTGSELAIDGGYTAA